MSTTRRDLLAVLLASPLLAAFRRKTLPPTPDIADGEWHEVWQIRDERGRQRTLIDGVEVDEESAAGILWGSR